MSSLIAGLVAGDETCLWDTLMASFGRAVITVRCLTEQRLPYIDVQGTVTELFVPKGSTITLHYNFDGRRSYKELRAMAGTSRHALLSIATGSHRVTLFNDSTLQFRSPTPQDVRQMALVGAAA